ncbi:hypothetical protein A3K01_03455 [candidate division WWE3 bacterium RIFOXYD1_FULL_43_17]|uniref:Uncharacterized protein n=3 Tax=Katanobacteria TaxID=422282 RepID=A0A1F4XDC6_UNCKA|nr:MAG: hypothetical protein UU59_C0016G0003 [candidate division WWE3 bacterium GW2011_GWE1_41_27]KKS60230.1 MAG: hypothetical protein UV26_C0006G0027 [candidate division WWE3 bacterium GW2011_GWF2_42_42]OGC79133.1 MAG: hypothetical protein A3K01_03455 [candidate division WWE3 bacterium RIFOXYD1_FULL_43_17]
MREEMQNSFRLFFSNELFLSRVYTFWAFFCMVVFGFFAIGTLTFSMVRKVNIFKEMRTLNYDLNVKLQSLSKLSSDLSDAQKYTPLLEATIPKELNTHSYMVSFMQQAGTAGFSVKNFIPASESTGGEVPIAAVLEGTGDLTSLISALEGMQRVTVIDSVKYETHSDTTDVFINLRIFNL